jgi:succinoglycan biosynthesis protein ExoM
MSTPLISIAICTYERPALLERALRSVLGQDGIDHDDLEIVVVDNSDSGSARAVIDALNETARPQIRYAQAHPANISVARNTAIAAARGAWIAFLDDDLAVEAGWLAAIRDAVERYDFDAMFGGIHAEFADPASFSELADRTFTRRAHMPAGSGLKALKRRDGQTFPLSTANCLLRRASLAALDGLFDPRFGQSGGEDFHLFLRMEKAGASFGWLPDAGCIELVPAHRCDEGYLARRVYAGSQAFAAAQIVTSRTPRMKTAAIIMKASLQLLSLRLLRVLKRSDAPDLLLREAGIRGKISWRELHPVYANEATFLKQSA